MSVETKFQDPYFIQRGGSEITIQDGNLDALVQAYTESVFDSHEVDSRLEDIKTHFQNELLKNPRTVIFLDEENPTQVIALGSWNVIQQEPELLIELTKLVILPVQQGKGLSKQLLAQLECSIRNEWLGAYSQVMITRNPRVVKPALDSGYTDIGVDAFWRLTGRDPEVEGREPDAWINSLKERGYTTLLKKVPATKRPSPLGSWVASFRRRIGF